MRPATPHNIYPYYIECRACGATPAEALEQARLDWAALMEFDAKLQKTYFPLAHPLYCGADLECGYRYREQTAMLERIEARCRS